MSPAASIVISGFGVREASWDRLRGCLRAVAAQEAEAPFEVLLSEMAELNGEVPEDIRDIVPGLRILPGSGATIAARKLLGVRSATAPVVVFLDADCLPQTGWLRSLLEAFQYYPEVAAVSGSLAGENAGWLRWLSPRRREAGPARSTAENNIAFRREAYLDCPLPEGPDAVRQQTAAMQRAHYVLWAEPAMQVMRDRRGLAQGSGALDYSTATR